MYIVNHLDSDGDLVEKEVFVSNWEVANEILGALESGEFIPDGSPMPDYIYLLDNISEDDIEVFWKTKTTKAVKERIYAMWKDLEKQSGAPVRSKQYREALKRWKFRFLGLSSKERS